MKFQKNLWIIVAIIVIAALSRLLPNSIANFTAVGAIAFMGGALIKNKYLKYLLPISILMISDIVLNTVIYSSFTGGSLIYEGMLWVYIPFVLSVFIGEKMLKKLNFGRVIGTALVSGLVFFLLSNFGVWMSSALYAKSFAGLLEAYAMGVPFFRSTLMGNAVYGVLIYGAYYFATQRASQKSIAN